MKKAFCFAWLFMSLLVPCLAPAESNAAEYRPITQTELVKNPEAYAGKKFQVTDTYLFCGSDFCADLHKTKINTREFYCFALGPMCLVRMYVKKDHPDAARVLEFKKGDKVTVYGTFDYLGSDYRFLVADRVVMEKGK
ncbi:MAG: hypothetical protein HZB63_08405 [Deltaproteobacteria bacterium]|nr:hypothetical protein [Deltaproteobacteria bacterium]